MILYLSRNENADLLDNIAEEKSMHIRKMSGNFCLSEFIIKDMRKFANCKYFVVERLSIIENDSEFLKALQSFQIMYSAKIIVINEDMGETNSLIRGLVLIGVTDIVTTFDVKEKLCQLSECMSTEGMSEYKPNMIKAKESDEEKEIPAQTILFKEMEDEQYRFDCLNINIGVAGSTRRVGTTTAAIGLANYIQNHGGTSCYVALNMNRHLDSIASTYNFDVEDNFYTYGRIDFYDGILPKYDYNFILTDFGDIKHDVVKKYKESDIYLLCGASSKRFEVMELADSLKAVKSVKPQILTYNPNPEYIQLFNTAVTNEPSIIKPVDSMMDFRVNSHIFKSIIEKYIIETSKRL